MDLHAGGWKSRTVTDEVRENFLRMLREGEELFPGIVRYDDTVVAVRRRRGLVRGDPRRSTQPFFERLPRDTHVFEYSLRAAHRGTASCGFARIQSRDAPEFSARSRSDEVGVE